MIRINLLGRPRPKVTRPIVIAGNLQIVLLVIPVLVAAMVIYVRYQKKMEEATVLREEIVRLENDKRQMGNLQQQIKRFEQRQAQLKQRLDVIDELKRNQSGPIILLDAVGVTVSLTDTLWLTSLTERPGNQIEFKGNAGSVDAVANFITQLARSGRFESIEIKESVQQPQQSEGAAPNFEFTLTARFILPSAGEEGAEESAASAAGGN